MLQPLSKLTPTNVKLKCTETEQKKFDEIKWIFTHDTLLAYLDFNENFDIHADASYFQLGAVIIHKVKPVVLYSQKLAGP